MLAVVAALVAMESAVACGRFEADDGPRDAAAEGYAIDVAVDAPPPPAQPCANVLAFKPPSPVDWSVAPKVKSARFDPSARRWYVSIKAPLSMLHAGSADAGSLTIDDAVLGSIRDTTHSEEQAMVVAYGQGLVFQSDRVDAGYPQLYLGVRTDVDAAFRGPVPLDVGVGFEAQDPYGVGIDVYFSRQLGLDKATRRIHHATLTRNDPPTLTGVLPVDALGNAFDDDHPVVTLDQLEIFWASKRGDAAASVLYHAHRASPSTPFGDVQAVSIANGLAEPNWISPDGCDLYFADSDSLFLATRR